MFLHWNGYEIDGSDTDFDIVLPERQQIIEFVKCFLSIPVFGTCKPRIYYNSNKNGMIKKIEINQTKLMKLLSQGERPIIYIDVNCQIMDAFPDKIQHELYQLSENRTPHEPIYGNVECPCMAPVDQQYLTRSNMTVTLTILHDGTQRQWCNERKRGRSGYIHHQELFLPDECDHPCFSLNVGPGFYYEYAIYIMEYLRDHFPGLGTSGGLDCSGGWTDGCTYSNSIYGYEKIQLPVRYSIKNTLKRLTECEIIRSYRNYYQNGWNYSLLNQFRMVNVAKFNNKKECLLSFGQYADYVESVLEQEYNLFQAISKTAIYIILPKPDRFEKRPELLKYLRDSLIDVRDQRRNWHYCGYLSFAQIKGQIVGEFRVPWYMKSYLLTLLQLKDLGKIDYVKAETYQIRQYEQHKN